MHEQTGRPMLALPVSDQRDHIQGPRTAAVTLVEYGDYECPYCGEAHPVLKELLKQFAGQVRLVFRNFPLTQIHPHAQDAAEAAEAASAQGRFWEMHDVLYERQDALEDEDLMSYAAELGLDSDRFQVELAEDVHAARIREDFMSGVRSGVNGTPTFFINGQRHDGGFDLQSLSDAVLDATSARTESGDRGHHRPHL
jgi:protein-disulfide isomerase